MAEEDVYTKDGTVDYKGDPADKKKTGTWKACPFILGNECCERLAYYGMSSNLVLYFKIRLHQHSTTASNNVTNWGGTCYITPLIGAFSRCLSREILDYSMLLDYLCSSLGTGGIKPCVSSYGADQFDDADEAEKKRKGSFFNWFYFSINVGALIAGSVLVYIQDNVGWGLGFGIPAAAMAIAVSTFFSGTRLYRNQKPGGSPLTRLCQVVVASFRKYRVEVPADKSLLYETADAESVIKGSRKLDHTQDLSFFDKAAVETQTNHIKEPVNPWRLCTVTQVEELKGDHTAASCMGHGSRLLISIYVHGLRGFSPPALCAWVDYLCLKS
ncbi:hypothetical protein NL676_005896 [Syzygium grande]|nr:hypothetical protein NL676_005896 [Syzygium grande]